MADSTKFLEVDLNSSSMPLLVKNYAATPAFRDAQAQASGVAVNAKQAGLYYAENVLPTPQGLLAVGNITFSNSYISGNINTVLNYTNALDVFCINIIDANLSKALLIIKVVNDTVNNVFKTVSYTYNPDSAGLSFPEPVNVLNSIDLIQVPNTATKVDWEVTVTEVQGSSLVCITAGFNEATSGRRSRITRLFKVTNNAIDGSSFENLTTTIDLNWEATSLVNPTADINDVVKGIFSNFQYLIAFTNNRIAWSSPTNVFDFTPSDITGAGSGIPGGIKGIIKACVPNPNGFNIYYTSGVMLAKFSNNPNFPFTFQVINTAAGLQDSRHLTKNYPQYAITSSGFVTVAVNNFELALPEISDFLVSNIYESYNSSTHEVESVSEIDPFDYALTQISDRYIALSYKRKDMQFYDFAIVYDTVLNALGKLKVPHVSLFSLDIDVFGDFIPYADLTNSYEVLGDWSYTQLREASGKQAPTLKYTIGVVHTDGSLRVIDPSLTNANAEAVALFGKFSIKEHLATTIDYVTFEDVSPDRPHAVSILTSYKNAGVDAVSSPTKLDEGGTYAKYGTRVTGRVHSVAITGSFNLTRMSIAIRAAGYR